MSRFICCTACSSNFVKSPAMQISRGPDQSTSLALANLVVLTRTDTITDKDGDSANSAVSINIGSALRFEDDAPSLDITGGDAAVVEGQSITNGTWTSAPGADAPATTKVVIGATEYDLGTAIDTGTGTLTVNSNGTWTFAASLNQSNPQAVTFTVRITDEDDDSASDSHTITINDGYACDAAITEGVPWGERGTGFGPLTCSGGNGTLMYTRSGADKTKNWTVADHVQETDVTAHVLIISDGADVRAGCANFF